MPLVPSEVQPSATENRSRRPESTSDLRFCGGRYWDRTSDLFRVKEARYRCANRPGLGALLECEVATGFEPV